MPVLLITSGSTWTVPSDYSTPSTIDCFGAGYTGGINVSGQGPGGGGGAFARKINLLLIPGSIVNISIGWQSGNFFTWFQSATTVFADGANGQNGGKAANCIGDLVFSGGAGVFGGGGGAGPNGAGRNSAGSTGGTGDNGLGGTGGIGGDPGNDGQEYNLTAGGKAGSGGGGGQGGQGGALGGGGGGNNAVLGLPVGLGGGGGIIITYVSSGGGGGGGGGGGSRRRLGVSVCG